MKKVVFVIDKFNKYSFSCIGSVLEEFRQDIKLIKVYSLDDVKTLEDCLICFSFNTLNFIQQYSKIKEILRDKKNNVFLCGGIQPSFMPDKFLEMGFDFVFEREAELSFKNFIYSYVRDQDIRSKFPPVVKSVSVDLNEFKGFSFYYKMFSPIEMVRGCKFNCSFCSTPHYFSSVKQRNFKNILNIIRQLYNCGIRDLRFINPNALDFENLEELLVSIHKEFEDVRIFLGTFPSEIRPEFVNEEKLSILKRYCANYKIVIGAQSGSDKILKAIKRAHTKEDVIKAVDVCVRYKFIPVIDFILGFPEETFEDRLESLKFMEELIKKGSKIHLHYFIPLPFSECFGKRPQELEKEIVVRINRFISEGSLFGEWQNQINLSFQVYNFFKNMYQKELF